MMPIPYEQHRSRRASILLRDVELLRYNGKAGVTRVTSLLCGTTTGNGSRSSNPNQSQTPTLCSSADPTTARAVRPFPSSDPLSVNQARSYSSV